MISQLVSDYRGPAKQSSDNQAVKEDTKSLASKKSRARSQAASEASHVRKEIEKEILALTVGKGAGMSEVEWNAIV